MLIGTNSFKFRSLTPYTGVLRDNLYFSGFPAQFRIPVQLTSDGTTFSDQNNSLAETSATQLIYGNDFETLSGITVFTCSLVTCPFIGSGGGNLSLTFGYTGFIVLPSLDLSAGGVLTFYVSWCGTDSSWSGSILVQYSDGVSDYSTFYNYWNPNSKSSQNRWDFVKIPIPPQVQVRNAIIRFLYTGNPSNRAVIDKLRIFGFSTILSPKLGIPNGGISDLLVYEDFENFPYDSPVTFSRFVSSSSCSRFGTFSLSFSSQGILQTKPVYLPSGGALGFYYTWCSTSSSFSGTRKSFHESQNKNFFHENFPENGFPKNFRTKF